MTALDIQIKKFIKKVRHRITEQTVLQYAGIGILVGFGAAVICSMVALFVPWYYAPVFGISAAILGIIAGCVFGAVKRPSMEEAALRLDAHGFQERLITSYGLCGKEDAFSYMQKQDTVNRIGAFQIRKTFPLKLRWQMLLAIVLLAGAFAGITCFPTAAKQQAAEYQEIAKQVEQEVAKVEEAIEHVEKIEGLLEDEKQDLIGTLENAKEELQSVNNADELAKAKERISVIADQEASKAENRDVREELQSLADAVSDKEKTEGEQLAEDLQDLQKDLQNLNDATSDKDKQAIANQLQQLGQQTGNQTMQNAAQQLANNNSLSQSTLQQAQQAVAKEQQAAQSSNQMASNPSNNSGNQNGQNNGQNNGQTNGQNPSSQSTESGTNNPQGNQNSSTAQNAGQSTESPSGQNGNNSANGSQGGNNSSGGQSGQNSQGGMGGTGYNQGSNQGVQKESTGNGSMVTIPNIEMQDNEALNGKVNSNGSSVTQKGGQAWSGNSVNYEQVIGDYSQNAYNKVESSNYPKGVQDIVKSYFDDLNQ